MNVLEYLSRFSLPLPTEIKGVVSFDFDGTLFSETWSHLSRVRLFGFLRQLRRHGIIWGINTGRNLPYLGEGVRELFAEVPMAFAPDFLITMERHVYVIQDGVMSADCEWNQRCDEAHEALFLEHGAMLDALLERLETEFAEYLLTRQEGDIYSLVVSDASCMDAVAERIERVIAPFPELVTQRAFVYLRFSHREFNKGTALKHLVQKFGSASSNVAIFGDGHNDLDAMKCVPGAYCCCPSNAVDEVSCTVRQSGGFVSRFPALSGVLEGLEFGVLPRFLQS